MNRIRVKSISEAERKDVSSAVDEYIRNCRLWDLALILLEIFELYHFFPLVPPLNSACQFF